MCAHHLWFLCLVFFANYSVASVLETPGHVRDKKINLFDGITVSLPPGNNTEKVMSFEVDTHRSFEGRGKQNKLMQRILPMFIMPFLIQSTIVPLFLSMLKFMLFKSLMVGKLALTLIILNAFKNRTVPKGRDAEMATAVYGYHGSGMEYGAYVN
ncbi:hypothetical protein ACJJTC_009159 [Scirpophaga incertulas]